MSERMLDRFRKLRRRIRHALSLPGWVLFRLANRGYTYSGRFAGIADGLSQDEVAAMLARHEELLRSVTAGRPGLRFLEIGIGSEPIVERMRLLQANGTRYTGVDFESVCADHRQTLARAGVPVSDIEFLGNRTGTYAWTLFELVRAGRRFDVVYLDGHHTFYVDLPAFLLADRVLEPGGWLLIDDIRWTLGSFRQSMIRNFSTWRFYHSMYDWSAYSADQQSVPHIGWIAQDLVIGELGYGIAASRSTPYWWALRKPPHDLARDVPAELSVLG
jgi:SAM-dependent methyltransferase